MIAKLPEVFRPLECEDLVRLGAKNDGGYLVSRKDVEKSSFLISFGINDDWSFERSFFKLKKVSLVAYDHSISFKKFLIRFLKTPIPFLVLNPILLFQRALLPFKYLLFFNNQRTHHSLYVGYEGNNFISLKSVFSKIEKGEKIFLKIDIEGSEYRILSDIIDLSKKYNFTGMVIEFHDVDIHLDKIIGFINKLELRINHVHVNNYSGSRLDNSLPLTIEVSFSSSYNDTPNVYASEEPYSHFLDSPNDKKSSEYVIKFYKNEES